MAIPGSEMVTALKNRVYDLAVRGGLPQAIRRFRRAAPIFCYHNVVDRSAVAVIGDPGLHMDMAVFYEQLEWIREAYEVIPLTEMTVSFPFHGDAAGEPAIAARPDRSEPASGGSDA